MINFYWQLLVDEKIIYIVSSNKISNNKSTKVYYKNFKKKIKIYCKSIVKMLSVYYFFCFIGNSMNI